jgi:DNA polymerase I
MNKILIIDSHAIAHSVKYSLIHLTYDEQSVGVILGFLRKIYSLATKFDTHKIVFTWDSKRRRRKTIYPNYKSKRTENKSAEMQAIDKLVYPQIDDLRFSIIPGLGFKNSFIQSGLEADDIIAVITEIPTTEEKIIISGDHDLYQLLDDSTYMYGVKKDAKLYGAKDFRKEWGIEPDEWGMVKQIAGCNTDNVEGIFKVGEKTAIKFLKGNLKPATKAYQNITKGKDIIERNKVLVKLPFPTTKPVELNWQEDFKIVNFLKITAKYGLYSMENEKVIDNWTTRFEMR